MKRWYWIFPLCLITGLLIGFLIGAFTAPIRLVFPEPGASQPAPVGTVDTDPAKPGPAEPAPVDPARAEPAPVQEQPVMQPRDRETFDARWEMAPDEIRSLAQVIAEGAAPDPGALAELGPEALSAGYPAPALDFSRDGRPVPYRATLLQEAVMAFNLVAAQTLLSQGADPQANHSEAVFMAIERRTPGAPNFMLFADHEATLPILRALLEAGADPNVRRHGFRTQTPLIFAEGNNNLGALLILLENGADPWLRIPYPEGGGSRRSLMEALVSAAGNAAAAETLFRILRISAFPPPPAEQRQLVLERMAAVVDRFASGTGPSARHKAWRLDQVLTHLGRILEDTEEVERIRATLTSFDYDADGGWYLAESEVHSRYDAPLSVPDTGDHVWGP